MPGCALAIPRASMERDFLLWSTPGLNDIQGVPTAQRQAQQWAHVRPSTDMGYGRPTTSGRPVADS